MLYVSVLYVSVLYVSVLYVIVLYVSVLYVSVLYVSVLHVKAPAKHICGSAPPLAHTLQATSVDCIAIRPRYTHIPSPVCEYAFFEVDGPRNRQKEWLLPRLRTLQQPLVSFRMPYAPLHSSLSATLTLPLIQVPNPNPCPHPALDTGPAGS